MPAQRAASTQQKTIKSAFCRPSELVAGPAGRSDLTGGGRWALDGCLQGMCGLFLQHHPTFVLTSTRLSAVSSAVDACAFGPAFAHVITPVSLPLSVVVVPNGVRTATAGGTPMGLSSADGGKEEPCLSRRSLHLPATPPPGEEGQLLNNALLNLYRESISTALLHQLQQHQAGAEELWRSQRSPLGPRQRSHHQRHSVRG